MSENKYDDIVFFEKYSQMDRSTKGLEAAGEWHEFKELLPDLKQKSVLDLGCGFGWHLQYAFEHGAKKCVGIDVSERMIERAIEETDEDIIYHCMPLEAYSYPHEAFDVIISSLTFHYIEDFEELCYNMYRTLVTGGSLIFSVEHPIFTAQGKQEWIYDTDGVPDFWPVDNYFDNGKREAIFLGEPVEKYHRTLTTYIHALTQVGFQITDVTEPQPSAEMLETIPGMKDELRRPMMLIISAKK